MSHPIHRVEAFTIVAPFTVQLRFEDDTERTTDFWPVLRSEMFESLRDEALFNQVRLDQEAHTIVWPNGADFDPATLHDWPERLDAAHDPWRRPADSAVHEGPHSKYGKK